MKSVAICALLFTISGQSSGFIVKPDIISATKALFCLKNDRLGWLKRFGTERLLVRSIIDQTSYPGSKHIILTVQSRRPERLVFDIEERDGGKNYILRNNASFYFINNAVIFKDPALGGVWGQDYLKRNIISSYRATNILRESNVRGKTHFKCGSYVKLK